MPITKPNGTLRVRMGTRELGATGSDTRMTMKHTLGPWQAMARTVWSGTGVTAGKRIIANTLTATDDEQDIANARLIAAAPDMLQALEELIAEWSDGKHESGGFDMARAAIAKATGENH